MKYFDSVKYCFYRMSFVIHSQCKSCEGKTCILSPYTSTHSYVNSNAKEKSILFKSTTLPNSSKICTRSF